MARAFVMKKGHGLASMALPILRICASPIDASCFGRHRALLCPGVESRCLSGSCFRQSLGMQGGDDGSRILVDHREQGAGGRFWPAASAFPMLDRIQTEAEGLGKAGLSHVELVANAFHIDFIRHMHIEAFPLSSEKSLNFVQSSHELCKRGFHRLSPDGLSPVAVKNIVGTLL